MISILVDTYLSNYASMTNIPSLVVYFIDIYRHSTGLGPGLGESYGNKARYMARVRILTNKVRIRVSIRKLSISSSVPYVHNFFPEISMSL